MPAPYRIPPHSYRENKRSKKQASWIPHLAKMTTKDLKQLLPRFLILRVKLSLRRNMIKNRNKLKRVGSLEIDDEFFVKFIIKYLSHLNGTCNANYLQ